MIKGCQKRIIHVKNTNSPYFEEAYFILKKDDDAPLCENDMVREALRIAENTCAFSKTPRKKAKLSAKKLLPIIFCAMSFAFGAAMLVYAILA